MTAGTNPDIWNQITPAGNGHAAPTPEQEPAPEPKPRARPKPAPAAVLEQPTLVDWDAEEHIIGAILLAGSHSPEMSTLLIDRLAQTLGDGAPFDRAHHQAIYTAARTLSASGQPTDLATLGDELQRTHQLDRLPQGRATLTELASLAPSISNAPFKAARVHALHRSRQQQTILQRALTETREGGLHDTTRDLLATALAEPETQTERDHTWKPVDLLTADTSVPEQPTIGGLIYPRRRHLLSGEPESLKSWLALVLCAQELQAGRTVLYVDLETTARDTLARLRDLNLTDEQISRFIYISPSEPIGGTGIAADVTRTLAEHKPSLVVVDAFAGLAHLHTIDTHRAAEIEQLFNTVIRTLNSSGAAILILDHVPKDKENRGKFAIGSERKVGVVDVHLRASTIQQFGRGRIGKAKIVTEKDRPGYLARPKAGELHLTSNATTGRITWEIRVATSDDEEDGQTFRPTALMEKVSRFLEHEDEPVTRRLIETGVVGKAVYVMVALDTLIHESYVREIEGARGARLNESIRPFRENDLLPTSSPDLLPPPPSPPPATMRDSAPPPDLLPGPGLAPAPESSHPPVGGGAGKAGGGHPPHRETDEEWAERTARELRDKGEL